MKVLKNLIKIKPQGEKSSDNISVVLQPIIEDFILNFICYDRDEKIFCEGNNRRC